MQDLNLTFNYVYIDFEQFPKFESALNLYKEWHELNDYLDEYHPIRMDGHDSIIMKRIACKNLIYKLLNLGFMEVESSIALANNLIPLLSKGQLICSDEHATLKILDEKKWGYFKIKAEL